MSGYLQRLLHATLPASNRPALTPVLKSTSPIFEQNQLLGLAEFHAGEADAEVGADVSRPPLPSAAVPAIATLEITPQDFQPVTPAGARDGAAAPLPPSSPDPVLQPVRPDPKIFETAPAVAPESATKVSATPVRREAVFAPAELARVATAATPSIRPEGISQPNAEHGPAAPQIVTLGVPRSVGPLEQAPDAPLPPSVLEPRPRPDFRDIEPDTDQPRPEHAPPRITIGRVAVEIVPDAPPVARSATAPRTAAEASVIGPLGNRRARRRLFALTRL